MHKFNLIQKEEEGNMDEQRNQEERRIKKEGNKERKKEWIKGKKKQRKNSRLCSYNLFGL